MKYVPLSLIIILTASAGCGGAESPAALAADAAAETTVEICLEIDTPAEGAWSTTHLSLVTGRLIGADGGEVAAGEMAAPVSDGFFSLWVPLEQGENVLTLVHTPTGVSATRTVHLDALPPLLTVEVPARGEVMPDGGTLEVRFDAMDEEGLAEVRVQDAALSPFGPFQALVPLTPGLHHIVFEAEDSLGNLAREHRTVLAGPLLNCDELADMPAMSLGAGADALQLIALEIGDSLATMDLGDILDAYNPVYESGSVQMVLTDITFDGLVLDLAPGHDRLELTVTVDEVTASGSITIGSTDLELLLDLSEVSVAGALLVAIPEPGVMEVTTEDLSLTTETLEITALDESGGEVISPVKVDGAFLDFVGDFIAALVEEQSAALLAGAAGYGEGVIPLEILGESTLIEYRLLDAEVQPTGLRLDMAGALTLLGEPVHPWEHGCPGQIAPMPDVPASGGLNVWVSYPFIDHILLGLWARGLLDFTADQAFMDEHKTEVTLVCGMLGTLLDLGDLDLDAETPLEIAVSTRLPPVLSPSSDLESGVALDIGGLTMEFSCAGSADPQARTHVALAATIGFEVSGARLIPTMEFGDLLLDVSGIPPDDKRRVESGVEIAMEGVFGELLPALSDAITPIDLPEMLGYQVIHGAAGNDPASGWFRIHALGMKVGE